jgi:cytochrome P450
MLIYWIQFGFGARTCIGRNLALVEINNFVAEFCRRYEASFVNKEDPYQVFSQWFSFQDNMLVYLTPRLAAL